MAGRTDVSEQHNPLSYILKVQAVRNTDSLVTTWQTIKVSSDLCRWRPGFDPGAFGGPCGTSKVFPPGASNSPREFSFTIAPTHVSFNY